MFEHKKPSWDDLWNCIWGSGRVSRDNRRLDTLFNCGLEGISVSQFLGYRRKILLVLFELLNYDNDCCYTQKKRLWSNLWFASYRWIQNFFYFFPSRILWWKKTNWMAARNLLWSFVWMEKNLSERYLWVFFVKGRWDLWKLGKYLALEKVLSKVVSSWIPEFVKFKCWQTDIFSVLK